MKYSFDYLYTQKSLFFFSKYFNRAKNTCGVMYERLFIIILLLLSHLIIKYNGFHFIDFNIRHQYWCGQY